MPEEPDSNRFAAWRYALCALLIIATAHAVAASSFRMLRRTPAQDDEKPPDIILPETASTAGAFVPHGWRMETDTDDALTGDLNGDGQPDEVLRLVQDLPLKAADGLTLNTRFRALVVLLGKKSGGFTRAAVSTKLLLCSTCAGMRGDTEGGSNIQIRIERDTIVVEQQSGSRFAYNHTLRFRHDRATKRFLLIGSDFDNQDTAQGDRTHESINYLTGLRLTRKYRYDKRRDAEVLVSNKSERIGRIRKFLEDVDYNNP